MHQFETDEGTYLVQVQEYITKCECEVSVEEVVIENETSVMAEEMVEEEIVNDEIVEEKIENEEVTEKENLNDEMTTEKLTNEEMNEEEIVDDKTAEENISIEEELLSEVTEVKIVKEEVSKKENLNEEMREEKIANNEMNEEDIFNNKITEAKISNEDVDEGELMTVGKIANEKMAVKASSNERSGVPNGGYGWFLLLTCVLIRMIVNGLTASFGIFLSTFVKEFEMPLTKVSWMASSISFSYLAVAPFAGILALQFGHRKVAMVGALLSAVCISLPYFYPKMWFVFVSASIMTGLCMGSSFICATFILTTYFSTKLPIAMGIYSAGTGMASLCITPIINILLRDYGWQFTLVCYSGLFCFAALLTFAFKPVKLEKKNHNNDLESNTSKITSERAEEIEDAFFGSKSSVMFNLFTTANEASAFPSREEVDANPYWTSRRSVAELRYSESTTNLVNLPVSAMIGMSVASNLQAIQEYNRNHESDSESEPAKTSELKIHCYLCLFKNPVFVILLLSNFLAYLGYDTVTIFSKQKAIELGVPELRATLLSVATGVASIIGRITFGYVGSLASVNAYLLTSCCLIIAGSSVIVNSLVHEYFMLLLSNIVFGCCAGGWLALGSLVLRHILTVDTFSRGLSFLFIAQALGVLFCAPLAGFIFDETGTFHWPFFVSGCSILVSGILMFRFNFCTFAKKCGRHR